jgi:hypothetical protein
MVCTKYILSMHWVCTGMHLVCTSYCFQIILIAANLKIEGMEAVLWQIEGIASCKHHTPEQLRLPFHTANVVKALSTTCSWKYGADVGRPERIQPRPWPRPWRHWSRHQLEFPGCPLWQWNRASKLQCGDGLQQIEKQASLSHKIAKTCPECRHVFWAFIF